MKTILRRSKFVLGVSALLSFALAPVLGFSDNRGDWRNEPVRECGTVTVQGGSLVINGRSRLVVRDSAFEKQLKDDVRRGPVNLCLLGSWENTSNGMVFRATRLD